MRVVAGSAGGIHLAAPNSDTRPTMDRVKAAIFSSLGERVPGARVLDLFAGGGGLGIEALSRGCKEAAFVDNDARAVEAIRDNLQKTGLRGTLHRLDVFQFLDRLASPDSFDLIFADPPYAKSPGARDYAAELLASDSLRRCLAPEGVFVLERVAGKTAGSPPAASPWHVIRIRKYGSAEILFLRINAGWHSVR